MAQKSPPSENVVRRPKVNSPRSFASRRSSNTSSVDSIEIPIAIRMNDSIGNGLNELGHSKNHNDTHSDGTSIATRQCNRFGFFIDSEEAAVE